MRADRSVLFNLSAAAIAEAGTKAAQFGTVVLIARALGPADFGIVGAAWALFQLALPFVQSAPELVGIRNLAADRTRCVDWITSITAVKMALAFTSVACLASYGLAIYGPQSRTTAQIASQALVLLAVASSPAWAARSLQRSDLYATVRTLQSAMFLVLAAALLAWHPLPVVVPLAEAVSWIVGTAAACRIMPPLLSGILNERVSAASFKFRLSKSLFSAKMTSILHYAAAGAAAAALWWSPVLLVEAFLGSKDAGALAVSVRIVTTAIVILQLGLQVYLPVLAKYYAVNIPTYTNLSSKLIFYSGFSHIICGFILFISANTFITLVFGENFGDAVLTTRIFSLMLMIVGFNTALMYILIAADRYRQVLLFQVIGVLFIIAFEIFGVVFLNSVRGLTLGIPIYLLQTIIVFTYVKKSCIAREKVFDANFLRPRTVMAFLLEK